MIIENKNIYLYGKENSGAPLVIVNTFEGDGKEVYDAVKNLTNKAFTMAVITDIDWNDEMAPWECPAMFKGDIPCTGGADKYLKKLEEIFIPKIIDEIGTEPEYIAIAGYSLGGLFAIYSLYKTAIFKRAVSASGSMWFPKFADFIMKNEMKSPVEKVYFSLGDKEAAVKNQVLKTVEENTRKIYEHFRSKNIESVFEMNPGNHFKDADLRLAKGIAYILE